VILPIAFTLSTQLVLLVADVPPQIDVEPVCRGIAQQGGVSGISHDLDKEKKDCITTEQTMREQLVKQWPTFSTADRASCITVVTKGGSSSYTELLTCLEVARDVKKLRTNPSQSLGPGR
jgi:hypothetical protein